MNRRSFIKNAAAVVAGAATLPLLTNRAAAKASRAVDTHTHFYDPSRKEGVPWPGKGDRLYRTVLPKDWLTAAAPHGVKETVVVEASGWLEDNAWILDLAAKERCITGFIGNLAPQDAKFAENLKRFAANRIFRGFRVSHSGFFNNFEKAEFRAGIKLMAEMNLTLDLNVSPKMLAAAAKFAADFAALRIVIDHVGGAGDPKRISDEWRDGMKLLGRQTNVFCKISALQEQTEQSHKTYGSAPDDAAYYAPILDHCLSCFGDARVIYGSNWPVCEKGGSYAKQFKIVSDYFEAKGSEASEKYFWKNSREAYRWVERGVGQDG